MLNGDIAYSANGRARRSAVPGDLQSVASWIEVVWSVQSDAAICCDISTCGHYAGWFRCAELSDPYVCDSVKQLWSDDDGT